MLLKMIDIIIPVLNEEKILREKREYYLWLKTKARVIFVDGGSFDQTVMIAGEYGKVIHSPCGRAVQMNTAAAMSQGESFLFLHVDTFLSDEALAQMDAALKNGSDGGCFTMKITEEAFIFRVFEFLVNFRARYFKVFDGDLGVFVKKDVFNRLGGFDQVGIMEDILFSKKLRKTGPLAVLPGKIFVSGRRWYEKGFWKTFVKYSQAYFQLWNGTMTNRLEVQERN